MSSNFQGDIAEANTRLRCAFYGLYSNDTAKRTSIEDQLRTGLKFAAARGWEILPDHIYKDVALSGTNSANRVGLRALEDVAAHRPRPFDCILLEKTCQLGRNHADVLSFTRSMKSHGVKVCFIDEMLDSSHQNFELMLNIFDMSDQMYVKKFSERIVRGQKARVLRGLHAGSVPYGYKTVKVHNTDATSAIGRRAPLGSKLEVAEDQAHIVRRIFRQFVNGHSIGSISQQINDENIPSPQKLRTRKLNAVWTKGAIRQILRNPAIRGEIVWNVTSQRRLPLTGRVTRKVNPVREHVRVSADSLRIVDDELWLRAADRLKQLRAKKERLLAG